MSVCTANRWFCSVRRNVPTVLAIMICGVYISLGAFESNRHLYFPNPLMCQMTNDYGASMFTFLGVFVKPGETVKCDPGESYYNVSQVTFTSLFIIDLLTHLEVDPICLLLRRFFFFLLLQIALADGKDKENVEVFVNTDDKRILLATLSVDNSPHFVTKLVLKKKFELLHSSMTSNICFTGYTFKLEYPSIFPSMFAK